MEKIERNKEMLNHKIVDLGFQILCNWVLLIYSNNLLTYYEKTTKYILANSYFILYLS